MANDVFNREKEHIRLNDELNKKDKKFHLKKKKKNSAPSTSEYNSPEKSSEYSARKSSRSPHSSRFKGSFHDDEIEKSNHSTSPGRSHENATDNKLSKNVFLDNELDDEVNIKLYKHINKAMKKKNYRVQHFSVNLAKSLSPQTTKHSKTFRARKEDHIVSNIHIPQSKSIDVNKKFDKQYTEKKESKKMSKKFDLVKHPKTTLLKSLNLKTSSIIEETFRNQHFSFNRSLNDLMKGKLANVGDGSVGKDGTEKEKLLSSEGCNKLLKAKNDLLQHELLTSTHLLDKRTKELEKIIATYKNIEAQHEQAISKNDALLENLKKNENSLELSSQKLKDLENELSSKNCEIEKLKLEIKIHSQNALNLEKRLFRKNESLENSKNAVNQLKNNEREMKNLCRLEKEENDKQVKILKKQRADLLQVYKKQLYLIDNLKKQNLYLEQSRFIKFGEKEFSKILEWNKLN